MPANNPSQTGGMSHEMRLMRLTIQKPDKTPVVLENGRFIVSSVESYDVGTVVSSCSFVARNNIMALLDTMGITAPWMAQGDANDLIRFGRLNNTLTSFTDKKLLLEALDERKDKYFETVFDVYRYVSRRSYAMQGHRVAVFLGDDEEWYILDPLDGKKTREPQLFRTYLLNDVDAEWLVRLPGYTMINLMSHEEFSKAIPYFSPELQIFFHTHYFESPQVIVNNTVQTQATL